MRDEYDWVDKRADAIDAFIAETDEILIDFTGFDSDSIAGDQDWANLINDGATPHEVAMNILQEAGYA